MKRAARSPRHPHGGKRLLASVAAFIAGLMLFSGVLSWLASRPSRLQSTIQRIAAREIANTLQCRAAVGPIKASRGGRFTIHGFGLSEPGTADPHAAIQFRTGTIRVSFWSWLLKRGSLAPLTEISVDRASVHLIRDAGGNIRLPFQPPPTDREHAAASEQYFGDGPKLSITDASIVWEDHQLTSRSEHLEAKFSGHLHVGHLGRLLDAGLNGARFPDDVELSGAINALAGAGPGLEAGIAAGRDSLQLSNVLAYRLDPREPELSLAEVSVEYDLRRLMEPGGDPVQGVQRIEIRGELARISRNAEGQFDILEPITHWLPEPDPDREVPKPSFQAEAELDRFIFTDRSITRDASPLIVEARQVELRANLANMFAAMDGRRNRSAGELSCLVSASVADVDASCRLTTDITRKLKVTELAATERGAHLASADRLEATFSLAALAEGDFANAFELVEGERVRATVELGADNQPTFLPPLKAGSPAGATAQVGPLATRLKLTDSEFAVTARSLGPAGAPLMVDVRGVNADLQLAALTGGTRRDAGTLSAVLDARAGTVAATAQISGTVGHGLSIENLHATDRGARILWANWVAVDLDCRRLADDPASAIDRVAIDRLAASVVRNADGRFAALPWLAIPAASGAAPAGPPDIRTRLLLARGDISFTDLGLRDGLSRFGLAGLSADVDVGRLLAATRGRPAGGIGTVRGSLTGSGGGGKLAAKFTADLSKRLDVRSLALRGPAGDRVDLGRAMIEFAASDVFGGRVLEGIRRIELSDGDLQLVRASNGNMGLLRLADSKLVPPARGGSQGAAAIPPGFAPTLKLANLRGKLTDHAAPEGPLFVFIDDLRGTANLRRADVGTIRGAVRLSSPSVSAQTGFATDLASRAGLTDLAIHELQDSGSVPLISAPRIQASWDMPRLLRGDLTGLRTVGLSGLRASLLRQSDGEFRLARLARGLVAVPAAQPAEPPVLAAIVDVSDGNVSFVDEFPAAAPVRWSATGLEAHLDSGRLMRVIDGERLAELGWVRGAISLDSDALAGSVRLDADLDRRLSLADLRVVELRGEQRVTVASIPRGRVDFETAGFFGKRPLEALRHVGLEAPDVSLIRNADGSLALTELVQRLASAGDAPAAAPSASPVDPGRFIASLQVSDGRFAYVDHALTGGGPFTALVTSLNGDLAPDHLATLLDGSRPEGAGRLTGAAMVTWPGAEVTGALRTDGRNVAVLSGLRVSDGSGGEAPITADELAGEIELAQLISPSGDPLASLRSFEARGLVANVHRDGDGNVDLVSMFEPFAVEPPPGTPTPEGPLSELLTTRILLRDTRVAYTDDAIHRDGRVSAEFTTDLTELSLANIIALTEGKNRPDLGAVDGRLALAIPGAEGAATLWSPDLGRGLEVRDLSLVRADEPAPAVSVKTLAVSYDAAKLAGPDDDRLAGLKTVSVGSPRVALTRDADGAVDLARLFEGFLPVPGEPAGDGAVAVRPEDFTGTVEVEGGMALFTDFSVEGGPVRGTLSALNATVDAGNLWRARDGDPAGRIGDLTGAVRIVGLDERLAVDLDVDLDRRARVTGVALTDSRAGEHLLVLDQGAATYDIAGLLAEDGDPIGALRTVELGRAAARVRRLENGEFALPRLVAAYLPEPTVPPEDAPAPAFLGGLGARVKVGDLSAIYDDAATALHPLQARVTGASADVDLSLLARLHAGERVESPGTIGATIQADCADARARFAVTADLGRYVALHDAKLSREDGRRPVITSARSEVHFDPVGLLSGEDPLPFIQRVSSESTSAEIILNPSGDWELLELLPALAEGPDVAAEPFDIEAFVARVRLSDTHITFIDRRTGEQAPVLTRLDANDLNGDLDMAAVWGGAESEQVRGPGELRGEFTALLRGAQAHAILDTDLSSRAVIRDLALSAESDGRWYDALLAREVRLHGDIGAALAGAPPTEQLRSLELWDLKATVGRDRNGDFDLLALIPVVEGDGPAEEPEMRLAGDVQIHGADIDYTDASLGVRGGVKLGARGLQGRVDLSAIQELIDGHSANDVGKISGSLAGNWGEFRLSGKVDADVSHSVTVDDLLLARESAERPAITATRAMASYDLAKMLQADDPTACVREFSADGLDVQIIRNPDGSLEIAQGMVLPETETGEAAGGGFRGRVKLAQSNIQFVDHSVRDPKPLEVLARGLSGDIDVGALEAMRAGGEQRDAGAIEGDIALALGTIRASGRMQGRFSSSLEITNASLTDVAPGGDSVQVGTLRADYSVAPVLAGEPPLPAIGYVGLHEATARLNREADGRLRLQRVIEAALWERRAEDGETVEATELGTFAGKVALDAKRVQFVDHGLLQTGPLLATLSDGTVFADLADPANPSGAVNADLHLRTRTQQATARLGGDLATEIALVGLQVTESANGEVLRADRLALAADWGGLISGRSEPLLAVRKVDLSGVKGAIRRDSEGVITSPEFLSLQPLASGAAEESPPGLAGRFDAWIAVHDVDLTVVDESVLGADGPLRMALTSLEGDVFAKGQLGGQEPTIEPRGSLRGHVVASAPAADLATDFETDLVQNLWVRRLVSTGSDGAQLARVGEIQASYDLNALLHRGQVWHVLRGAKLDSVDVAVGVTENGQMSVAGLPIRGVVLRKAGVSGQAGRLAVQGHLTTDETGAITGRLRTEKSSELASDTALDLTVDPTDGWLDATFAVGNLDAAAAGGLLMAPDQGRMTGGSISGSGVAYGYLRDQGSELVWTLDGRVDDLSVQLDRLGDSQVTLSAPFRAGSEGVRVDAAQVAWSGIKGTLGGSVYDLNDPVLALKLTAEATASDDLARLIPPQMREQLTRLALTDRLSLAATITGPVEDAEADVTVRSSGEVVASVIGLGEVRADRAFVDASIIGADDPSVRASMGLRHVGVDAPGAGMGLTPWRDVEPEAQAVTAQLLSAGSKSGAGVVAVPEATLRGVEMTNLTAFARLTDRGVEIPGLSAEVLRGTVEAAGTISVGGGAGFTGRARVKGARLSQLAALDSWPASLDLDGSLDAMASGTFGGADTNYVADVKITEPLVNGRLLESAHVVLEGDRESVTVPLGKVSAGDGAVWVRGNLEHGPDGPLATPPEKLLASVDLVTAEFDLNVLPLGLDAGQVGGVAYLSAHASGPVTDPDFSLRTQIFSPAYEEHRADAILAEAHRDGADAAIDHLFVAAGNAVVGLTDIAMRGFTWHSLLDKPSEFVPDASLTGGLVRAYGPAEDLARVAREKLDTGGWFQVSGALGGTLQRPTLTCQLVADHLQAGEFFIDQARLPLSLSGETLRISDGYVRTHGGELSVVARVDDLYGERDFQLAASLPSLSVEDLPTVHRLNLDLSGQLAMPQLSLWGNATSRPSGGATFHVTNMRVGTQELEPITGWLNFGGGMVHVDATKIRKASTRRWGRRDLASVGVSATYAMEERFVQADVRVAGPRDIDITSEVPAEVLADLPDIGDLLQLAAPIAAVAEAVSRNAPVDSAQCVRRAGLTRTKASAGAERPQQGAAQILAQMGLRASGQVAGDFRLLGPMDDLNCTAQVALWNAEVDGNALPRQIRAKLAANLQSGEIYDIDAEAVDGRQYSMVSGRASLPNPGGVAGEPGIVRPVDLVIEGADIELPMWRQWLPNEPPIGGSATFVFVVKGDSASPNIKGSLDVLKPSYAGAQFDVLKLPLIEVKEGAVNVRNARLIRSDEAAGKAAAGPQGERVSREIAMQGSLPWTWAPPWVPSDGEINFTAALDAIDLAFFPMLLDEVAREQAPPERRDAATIWSSLEARGSVTAGLSATGTWGAPKLDGQVKLQNGSIRGPGWKRPVDNLQVDLRVSRADGRNRADVVTATAGWGTATVSLTDTWAYLDHLNPADLELNEYHMEMLVNTSRPMDAGGVLVDKISGGASFHTRMSDIGGASVSTGEHDFVVKNLAVKMGSGNVTLKGQGKIADFSLTAFHENEYDYELGFNSAHLRYGKKLRGLLDGKIAVGRRADMRIANADEAAPVAVTGDVVLSQAEIMLAIPKSQSGEEVYGLSRVLPSPVFDVAFHVGDGVRFKGLGMTLPIARSEVARLTGTLHEPVVQGEVRAREGAVKLAGEALQINSAGVDYRFGPVPAVLEQDRVPLALTGTVNAGAQKLITEAEVPGWGTGSVEIYIDVEGDLPGDIRVNTYSVPPLTEQQIFALLGSQPLGGLQVSGQSFEEILSEQALNALATGFRATVFEPIETELMRILGLSEFSINFGFDQAIDLRVGKYLIKDLLVSYERKLSEGEGDSYVLSLSYRLKDRLRVAYTTNERSETRVKLTYSLDL